MSLSAAPAAMPSPSLPDLLRALEGLSARMRLAAEAGDWPAVEAMQGTCSALIGRVRSAGRHTLLSPAQHDEKQRIMLALLHDDARIRQLAAHLPAADATPAAPRSDWLH